MAKLGRPKGAQNHSTARKEQAREALRAIVMREMDAMVAAQVANSKGLKYLITRDRKSGKFIRVTEAMAKVKQGQEDTEEIIEVWEKDPSVQAFTDLMNRTLDKPADHVELSGEGQGPILVKWQE